ncbi:glutathione S-transferase T1-like isoform X2 [Andrographis paniculata]|nr:glutathione S-transferase T1-like isoform X2 [Andrographis paniculata]
MQHRSPHFAEINPMRKVPALVHGDFKLFESHAILIYLASTFGVADHWYPADIRKRAKIHAILDWHHANLRRGSVGQLFYTSLAVAYGLPLDLKAAAKSEELLSASLAFIEKHLLEEDKPFLAGNSQPSIADLSLACEIMQLEAGDDEDLERILRPHKKILKWLEDTKNEIAPYFEQVHDSIIPITKEMNKHLRSQGMAKLKLNTEN